MIRLGLGAAHAALIVLVSVAPGQAAMAQDTPDASPPSASSSEMAPTPATIPPEAEIATPDIETPAPATSPAPQNTSQCPPPAADAAPCIPALTAVRIAIRAHLGSKISQSGQTFAIELAEPVVIDGTEVLPAGTPGMGEVVHAKKSGGSGASGELILAARYLEIAGRRLRLRSMNFAAAGEDNVGAVTSAAIASSATIPVLAFVGFLVKGKPIDIPEGTLVNAKTAEPFVLDPPIAAPALPEAASNPPPTEPGEHHEN